MYAPSTAALPTKDGVPVAGHFTSFALGYLAFQVFTVDFIAAETHGADPWNPAPPASIRPGLPRIWPQQANALDWPPPAFANDAWPRLVNWNGALRRR
jgi:hypothetical protein